MTGDEEDAALILLPAASTAKAAADRFIGDVWVDTITEGALQRGARLATVRRLRRRRPQFCSNCGLPGCTEGH
jgi:hypothetical protein